MAAAEEEPWRAAEEEQDAQTQAQVMAVLRADMVSSRAAMEEAQRAKDEQAQLVSSLERVAAMMNVDSLDAAPVLAPGELRTSKKTY